MNKKIYFGLTLVVAIALSLSMPSCKRYADLPPFFEAQGDTTRPITRKVLFIGIDGAVSAEYKKMSLPVLQGMLAKSKYTWEGATDEVTTDAASWKTLMTGVSYVKHKIQDSSFVYAPNSSDPPHSSNLPNFPSIFSYILSSSRNDLRTTVITPWRTLVDKLVPEALDPLAVTDDLAVKDSSLTRIKNGNPDFMVVNFNSAAIAGKAGAFNADDAGYKDAALKIDGYIGELLTAVKARPGYEKSEEWLIIVASTHGGIGNTYGGAFPGEVNSFAVYYQEKFKPLELVRPGFSGVTMKGSGTSGVVRARIGNDGGLYNPELGQQTVSVKIKGPKAGNWPHFFSKMETFQNTPGWSVYTYSNRGDWCISVCGSSGGERRVEASGTPVVLDDKWHTITFKFMDSASKRWVIRYTDGVRIDGYELTNSQSGKPSGAIGSISTTAQLTMGWAKGNSTYTAVNVTFADCMIFNTSLSDAEIAALQCANDITQHSKYANLIGYWPCGEGFGGRFVNMAPGAVNKDLLLEGAFGWGSSSTVPCNRTPFQATAGKAPLFLKSVDITTTCLYWLRMNINPTWGLEGSMWLEPYETEFIKL